MIGSTTTFISMVGAQTQAISSLPRRDQRKGCKLRPIRCEAQWRQCIETRGRSLSIWYIRYGLEPLPVSRLKSFACRVFFDRVSRVCHSASTHPSEYFFSFISKYCKNSLGIDSWNFEPCVTASIARAPITRSYVYHWA